MYSRVTWFSETYLDSHVKIIYCNLIIMSNIFASMRWVLWVLCVMFLIQFIMSIFITFCRWLRPFSPTCKWKKVKSSIDSDDLFLDFKNSLNCKVTMSTLMQKINRKKKSILKVFCKSNTKVFYLENACDFQLISLHYSCTVQVM